MVDTSVNCLQCKYRKSLYILYWTPTTESSIAVSKLSVKHEEKKRSIVIAQEEEKSQILEETWLPLLAASITCVAVY